jgi:TetR/AcrR family transcriptional regulator
VKKKTPKPRAPRRKIPLSPENAQERIIKAARKVFSRHPFKAASTRLIAREARLDHPLIHYYFGCKEKLFDAVSAAIYEEYSQANRSWLAGLDRKLPAEGLSIYLDRMIDYTIKNPEALQIIFLNMLQDERRREFPGLHYFRLHMDQVRVAVEGTIPIQGERPDFEMFIHCFNNMVISLLGARKSQALVLNLDPDSAAYKKWVKDALFTLFLPWLTKLIFPEKEKS